MLTTHRTVPGSTWVTTVDLENDNIELVQQSLWGEVMDRRHEPDLHRHFLETYQNIMRMTGIRAPKELTGFSPITTTRVAPANGSDRDERQSVPTASNDAAHDAASEGRPESTL